MNPLIYLVAALAIFTAGFGGGHRVGTNAQKVADQAQFDQINADLTEQKATANAVYRKFQENNLALMVERDKLKTNLEKENEAHRVATAALRDKYAAVGLRYSAAQDAGHWPGGGSPTGAGADPASPAAPAVVQLPDPIATNLRRLTFDADTLADNYRKCYGYASQVK